MTHVAANSPFLDVAAQLRGRIVTGEWAPGSQLPTWDRMAQEFAVARPTLMRAMDRLRQDGFIYSKSTRGTFVSERPPHLSRFGLVFASHPGQGLTGGWNRFWDTLVNQAPVLEHHLGVELPTFFDVCDPSSDGHESLTRQTADSRLAGLILVGRPDLMELPVAREASLPKVAIYGGTTPDMPRVFIDRDSFVACSLDHLQQRGARAVAVLSNNTDRWEGFAEAIEQRGFESKPFWRLAGIGEAVTPLVRLLFDPDNARVPDSLIIADDNIVEHALQGLLAAGVAVPDRVKVVTHCNWPAPVPSPVPVTRLGYDVAQLLARCVEAIQHQRAGRPVPEVQRLEAVFEDGVRQPAPARIRVLV